MRKEVTNVFTAREDAVLHIRKLGLPVLDHQIELVDKTVDFFKIFTTALFGFDVERATKSDHVAQVTDGVL